MVGDPELQGNHGQGICPHCRRNSEVAEAILEHYLPRFAEDRIFSSTFSAPSSALPIRLDDIAGCFGVGLIPTGTAHPDALRRQQRNYQHHPLQATWKSTSSSNQQISSACQGKTDPTGKRRCAGCSHFFAVSFSIFDLDRDTCSMPWTRRVPELMIHRHGAVDRSSPAGKELIEPGAIAFKRAKIHTIRVPKPPESNTKLFQSPQKLCHQKYEALGKYVLLS